MSLRKLSYIFIFWLISQSGFVQANELASAELSLNQALVNELDFNEIVKTFITEQKMKISSRLVNTISKEERYLFASTHSNDGFQISYITLSKKEDGKGIDIEQHVDLKTGKVDSYLLLMNGNIKKKMKGETYPLLDYRLNPAILNLSWLLSLDLNQTVNPCHVDVPCVRFEDEKGSNIVELSSDLNRFLYISTLDKKYGYTNLDLKDYRQCGESFIPYRLDVSGSDKGELVIEVQSCSVSPKKS